MRNFDLTSISTTYNISYVFIKLIILLNLSLKYLFLISNAFVNGLTKFSYDFLDVGCSILQISILIISRAELYIIFTNNI